MIRKILQLNNRCVVKAKSEVPQLSFTPVCAQTHNKLVGDNEAFAISVMCREHPKSHNPVFGTCLYYQSSRDPDDIPTTNATLNASSVSEELIKTSSQWKSRCHIALWPQLAHCESLNKDTTWCPKSLLELTTHRSPWLRLATNSNHGYCWLQPDGSWFMLTTNLTGSNTKASRLG